MFGHHDRAISFPFVMCCSRANADLRVDFTFGSAYALLALCAQRVILRLVSSSAPSYVARGMSNTSTIDAAVARRVCGVPVVALSAPRFLIASTCCVCGPARTHGVLYFGQHCSTGSSAGTCISPPAQRL